MHRVGETWNRSIIEQWQHDSKVPRLVDGTKMYLLLGSTRQLCSPPLCDDIWPSCCAVLGPADRQADTLAKKKRKEREGHRHCCGPICNSILLKIASKQRQASSGQTKNLLLT